MNDGNAELDRMIAKLRALPQVVRESVPDVADVVRDELARTIADATTPEGNTWQRTAEGKKPLVAAASALRVVPIGDRVFVRLSGHHARHNYGRAKGGIRRRILPLGPVPRAMADAIRKVLAKRYRDHMGEP